MSLPLSRDFDVADGDPIPHTLYNNVQDSVIEAKHGNVERILGYEEATPSSAAVIASGGGAWDIDASNASVVFPVPFIVGTRLTEIRGYVQDNATQSVLMDLFEKSLTSATYTGWTGVSTTQKSSGASNGYTSIAWTSTDSGIPFTLLTGKSYKVAFQNSAAGSNLRVIGVRFLFEKP